MKKFPIIAAALSMGLITTPAIAHPHAEAEMPAPPAAPYIKAPGQCIPLTEDKFRALDKGMTIDEIEYIVGCRGKEFVRMDVHNGQKINYVFKDGRKTVLWIWTLNGFLDQKGGNQ